MLSVLHICYGWSCYVRDILSLITPSPSNTPILANTRNTPTPSLCYMVCCESHCDSPRRDRFESHFNTPTSAQVIIDSGRCTTIYDPSKWWTHHYLLAFVIFSSFKRILQVECNLNASPIHSSSIWFAHLPIHRSSITESVYDRVFLYYLVWQ
jgi:hypothetical protein